MAYLKKANNAHSTINQVGGLTLTDLSLTVTDASSFPDSGDFLMTIWDSVTYPDPTDDSGREIIKVTNVAGNLLTIIRAQEDTVASLHSNGVMVANLITAGTFEELETAIDNVNTSGVNTLFVSQYDDNGDLSPIGEFFGQGGGFELDSAGDIVPKDTSSSPSDYFFDYDSNNDLSPKEK